jgi:phage baseplate assembly protein W
MAGTDFSGRGWNFPVRLSPSGQIELVPGEESIRQSIWTILSTAPGERVMRPAFGCGINDLVFGVNNAATATAVSRAVREALGTWEPRIDVLGVSAGPDPADPSILLIGISYQVRSTNSRYNLVYPFYLE